LSIFNENLLHIHCWLYLYKNFKISQHLIKLQARKLIASRAQCAPRALSCGKMKNSTDILSMAKKQLLLTVVTLILTWLR